jgi:hypothetical protein
VLRAEWVLNIAVRHGVSKMVEDGRRGKAVSGVARRGKAVSGVARPQGVEGQFMAGPGETVGSPWPPLAILPCLWSAKCLLSGTFRVTLYIVKNYYSIVTKTRGSPNP